MTILNNEVCYNCAKKSKHAGFHITYDMYLSERYPNDVKNDCCEICGGDFNVDGRKIKRGVLKSNIWSFC
jgi:hypothetical protein